MLTKTSWMVLFGLLPLLWILTRVCEWAMSRQEETASRPSMRNAASETGFALLSLSICVLVVNLAYGFDGSFKQLESFDFISKTLTADDAWEANQFYGNRFTGSWIGSLPVPLPEDLVIGMDLQKSDFDRERWSYFRGDWLTLLVSAFLGFGLLGAILIYAGRRLASMPCPYCLESIPKDVSKKGVPCPECEHPPERCDVIIEPNGECPLCQSANPSVDLWDGQSYCESCVQDVSPNLLATSDDYIFSEDLPFEIRGILTRAGWFYFRLILGWAFLWGIPVAITGGLADGLFIFGMWFLLRTPIVILWSIAASLSFPLANIRTMVWQNQLLIRMGTSLHAVPLQNCSWYEGEMSDTTVLKTGLFLRGPSLVIDLPKRDFKEGNNLAVGCTPEALEVWRAFLTIDNVPVGYKMTTRTWFLQVQKEVSYSSSCLSEFTCRISKTS